MSNLRAATSNQAFRELWPELHQSTLACHILTHKALELERELANVLSQLEHHEQCQSAAVAKMEELKPRLCWCSHLAPETLLTIVSDLGSSLACAAPTCRAFNSSIIRAKSLGLAQNSSRILCAAAGSHDSMQGTSYGHTAIVTMEGHLFTSGDANSGALGHGIGKNEPSPRLVMALSQEKIVAVAAGAGHTIVSTQTGRVFTFGCGQYGKLGHNSQASEYTPRLVKALADVHVSGVAAGYWCTAAFTDAGHIFTWGQNGALGHVGSKDEPQPRVVQALIGQKVIGAQCGSNVTVAYTETGSLWTFGSGETAGRGEPEYSFDAFDGSESYAEYQASIRVAPGLVEGLVGHKVIDVAAGGCHVIGCTDTGKVFVFGSANAGRLGLGSDNFPDQYYPVFLEALADEKVVAVAALKSGSLVCTAAGKVFGFGNGIEGQLGLGEHNGGDKMQLIKYSPQLIESLSDVEVVGLAAMSCAAHSVVWTRGQCFTFGSDTSAGRLAHGGGGNVYPRRRTLYS